jgi:hypothetical protein
MDSDDNALFSVAQGHAFFAGTCGTFLSSAITRGSPSQYGVAPRYKFVVTTWNIPMISPSSCGPTPPELKKMISRRLRDSALKSLDMLATDYG